jgi:hypothetical protein
MGDCQMIFLIAFLQAYIPLNLPILPISNNSVACPLNSAAVRCAHGLWIDNPTDVKYVLFYVGTVTTGDTIRISLQYADANGLPSGTPLVSASLAVTTAMQNTWQEITFPAPYSVTGTPRQLFVVYDYETYNSGNLNIVGSGGSDPGWRYVSGSYNGSSWTLTGTTPSSFLRKSDGTVVGLGALILAYSSASRSSSNNPNEGGVACTFNRPVRIVGVARTINTSLSAINSVYSIYQGSSLLWTANSPAADTTASAAYMWLPVMLDQPIIAQPGTEYIFAWRPTTTTGSSILFADPGLPSQYHSWFTAYTGGMCRLATRQYGNAWTFDSGTQLWYVYPIIEEVLGGVQ